jgi:hypothetical protein
MTEGDAQRRQLGRVVCCDKARCLRDSLEGLMFCEPNVKEAEKVDFAVQ